MMSSSTVTISALIRSNGWCIVVSGGLHDGVRYVAKWWTRNQEPGASPWGPWRVVEQA